MHHALTLCIPTWNAPTLCISTWTATQLNATQHAMCNLCVHAFGAKAMYGHKDGNRACLYVGSVPPMCPYIRSQGKVWTHRVGNRACVHVYGNMSSNCFGNVSAMCPHFRGKGTVRTHMWSQGKACMLIVLCVDRLCVNSKICYRSFAYNGRHLRA